MTNRKPLDTASQVILNDRLRNTKQWSRRQNQRDSASGGLKKIPETGTDCKSRVVGSHIN